MKNVFKTIAVVLTALTFTLSANAQDDKISGIYVDGVKVTEIDCYSFKEMEFILSIDKLKSFDQIEFRMPLFNSTSEYAYVTGYKGTDYSTLALNSFTLNGIEYGKFKIFQNSFYQSNLEIHSYDYLTRNDIYVNANSNEKRFFVIVVTPQKITGYEEKYDEICSCVKRNPKYTGDELMRIRVELKPNTNGNLEPKVPKTFKERLAGQEKLEVDVNLPCPVKGTSLEELQKSETKTAPINTTGGAGTLGLKTITEKHKNGKVKVQGQNNKDGNQEGTWKYFNELGKLERVENYKNGISHGEWKYYDTNTGKVTKIEKYNEGELVQ